MYWVDERSVNWLILLAFELESLQLLVILDGLATHYFLIEQFEPDTMFTLIRNKYKI
jgi:hypothetical protein